MSSAGRSGPVLTLDAGGTRITVGGDPELISQVDEVFADVPRVVDEIDAFEELAVVATGTGAEIRRSDGTVIAAYTSIPAMIQGLAMVVTRHMMCRTRRVFLHAGVLVSPEGRSLAVAGPSGSGKTTLSAALASAGWEVVSDEIVGFDPDALTAHSWGRPFSIKAGSPFDRCPTDSSTAVDAVAMAPTGLGYRLRYSAPPVSHLVFPRYEPGASTELCPQQRSHVLGFLIENLRGKAVGVGETLRVGGRVAAAAVGATLVHDDLDEAVEAITAWTRTPVPAPLPVRCLEPPPPALTGPTLAPQSEGVWVGDHLALVQTVLRRTVVLGPDGGRLVEALDGRRSMAEITAQLSIDAGPGAVSDTIRTLAAFGFLR